jgi:hypothetical protein
MGDGLATLGGYSVTAAEIHEDPIGFEIKFQRGLD